LPSPMITLHEVNTLVKFRGIQCNGRGVYLRRW
jgi:hypothetical protein